MANTARTTLDQSFSERDKAWDKATRRIRKEDRERAATKAFETRLKKELLRWAAERATEANATCEERRCSFNGWVLAHADLTGEERNLILDALFPGLTPLP